MVHRVVAVRRRDRAGFDADERVRSVDALEIDVGKVLSRGARAGHDAGIVEAVRDAHARETTAQHFAGGSVEAVAVLYVIQLVLGAQRLVEGNEILAGENGSFAGLIEIEPAQVYGGADLDGLVQEIRLGKAEAHIAQPRAQLRLERERLSQAQEVVGGVIESDEAAGDA